MRSLPQTGGPGLGLAAVLARFVVQDLVQTLPLALLGRRPFMPAKVPIRPESHYRVQAVLLPAFGVGVWLLMGRAAQASLELTGHHADLRRVLDVIGLHASLGARWRPAALAGLASSTVYVLGASRLVR